MPKDKKNKSPPMSRQIGLRSLQTAALKPSMKIANLQRMSQALMFEALKFYLSLL